MPGLVLLFIGCGCLFDCRRLCGSAALGREVRPDECGASATTAMWPAVWHGGRPLGRRATTRRIGLRVMPQRQRRQNDGISCRPPAGGGQIRGSGWMRRQPQTRTAARTKAGRAARGVTGAEHLARHLPNLAAVRPFFLRVRGSCAVG